MTACRPSSRRTSNGSALASDLTLPGEYGALLSDLKGRIRSTQTRAALAVNQELALLYWHIGQRILAQQAQKGWVAKVIDQLARDLKAEFPDLKGFSPRNLKYMQQFAATWPDLQIGQQAVAQQTARCCLSRGR
ncbi:DUF1016 N-terminal domain-containing protein [Deinococcus yunweiensis]|uniref:DUF1016 N-terminal domain-containing protein n=1 Tax=Deinococcus yunweiensis TaxID=367282 RepID=UPI00398EEB25